MRSPWFVVAGGFLFLLALWYGFHTIVAFRAYRDISADVNALETYENRNVAQLSQSDLLTVQSYVSDIDSNLRTLDRATTVPIVGGVVNHVPWIGERYETGRALINIGRSFTDAAGGGIEIGIVALNAYESSGFTNDGSPTATTWLDVISQRRDDIERLAKQLESARQRRAEIDTTVLPGGIKYRVDRLDRLLDRYDFQRIVNEQLPALEAALGATAPVRYMVLFPNPAELRPAGGFPGTAALVTFQRGQLTSFAFHDLKQISDAYLAQRNEIVPAPLPIATYLFDDGFLPHDTVWWADFTRVGQDFVKLYSETDWPPIDGVVAVQPSAIADLLTVTGPLTIDVDGEMREITAANVFVEMELQRVKLLEGEAVDTTHKEVIAIVGAEIMARFKTFDRQQLRSTMGLMRAAADRRDIQIYSLNATVQQLIDEQAWSGRIVPDQRTPTLAVTFANMVATKSSLRMVPEVDLRLGPSTVTDREVTVDIRLTHTGTNDENPYYSGFQRWWIQVNLPEGSTFVSSGDTPQTDPDAPDGGAYLIELFPQQTGTVSVTFRMPLTDTLLFRRQPGLNDVKLATTGDNCAAFDDVIVRGDVRLDIAAHCSGS